MPKLVLFNKPFGVLSQFTDTANRDTLKKYLHLPGFRPAGRLDQDSEGLLLLTDNGALQNRIADPRYKESKSYWVQVEGEINNAALQQLAEGILLNDGMTLPAQAVRIPEPVGLWERQPPIRQRQSISTSWLELSIKEGRNRQVRRMTAAAGFPTLRLIRHSIGQWQLGDLAPGEYRQLQVP